MATLRYQHYEVVLRPDGKPFELGRGAMGITYKAFDTNLRSEVCLKVINAQFLHSNMARERFLREARAAARIRHPNVASVYHLGQDGNSYFYSMEFVQGETLQARVKREGVLPVREVLEIALQVSRALAAAQREKLVHRDLKPANIMLVDEYGEMIVKLIDFGLAKATAEEGGEDVKALTMGFVGTPDYASPEQIEEKPLDTRSDVYSLGATLWYSLTGKVMYSGTIPQVMAQQMDRPPPWELLAAYPPEVIALLGKMLEKDRDQRPRDPVDLRGMIEQCLRTVPIIETTRSRSASGTIAEIEPTLAADSGAVLKLGNATTPSDATILVDDAAATAAPPSIPISLPRAPVRIPIPSAPPPPPPPPARAAEALDPTALDDVTLAPPPAARSGAADGPKPAPGVLVARRYKIGALLTSQPPHDTFLSEDMATGRPVSVRVLPAPEASEIVGRQELLQRLSRLRNEPHPHLLNVVALEAWNGGTLVVMEWTGGTTLADRLRSRGQLPRPELIYLIEPIAEAIDHAAGRRITGLELTPQGIALPGTEATTPFNASLSPALKVSLFGIHHTPPNPDDQAFDLTMVVPASRTIAMPPDEPAELNRFYQRELVGLICELLGRPRPRRDKGNLAPISALGEEGNAALRRARGDEAPAFATSAEFVQALRSQSFVSRAAKPPMPRLQLLRVPPKLLTAHQAGVVLTLTAISAAAGEVPLAPLRIVARDEFRIGRSPADADLVSWFLPRTPENDELSRRLSKVHCALRRRGGHLFACDSETSNGTELDGRPLPKNATGEPLPERGHLALDTRFRVDFHILPGSPTGSPQIENLTGWTGVSSPTSIQPPPSIAIDPTAVGGVMFTTKTAPALRRAVWLLASLAFGADPALPLSFPLATGLQPLQGYVHHYLGHFWLENLDGNGAVQVDSIALGAGEIAPLVGGQRLRVGALEFQLAVE